MTKWLLMQADNAVACFACLPAMFHITSRNRLEGQVFARIVIDASTMEKLVQ